MTSWIICLISVLTFSCPECAGSHFSLSLDILPTSAPPSPTSAPPPTCPRNSKGTEGTVYTLNPTQDVWLEESRNKNYYDFLIVGKHPGYEKKRTLIQFEDLPQGCCRDVKSAKMFLFFWYAHKASWQSTQSAPYIPRPFQVHQMERQWKENEATSIRPVVGTPQPQWNHPYVAIDGQDAVITPTDSTTIYAYQAGSYIELDITESMQNWISGQPNYGVLIWATNEDVNGRGFRFYSREHSCNKPFVHVLCA